MASFFVWKVGSYILEFEPCRLDRAAPRFKVHLQFCRPKQTSLRPRRLVPCVALALQFWLTDCFIQKGGLPPWQAQAGFKSVGINSMSQ